MRKEGMSINPVETTTLNKSINRLNDRVDALQEALSILFARIDPVLLSKTPEPENDKCEGLRDSSKSEIRDRVDEIDSRIAGIQDTVLSIIGRVDL